ncbi:MAG: 3'-5' exonuclease [Treponema sp.]|nr:3'-5' exonuclease [Treponema sp.]
MLAIIVVVGLIFISGIIALLANSGKTSSEPQTVNVNPDKIIIFDTETTGTDSSKDEILELAIMNGSGDVLFNERIKPLHRKRWPNAEAVHGISPKDVQDCKTFAEYQNQIQSIFDEADVIVGYNVEFDKKFVSAAGIHFNEKYTSDVMKEFADERKIWDDVHGHNKWFKLEEAAKFYNYTFEAHHALDDAKATLYIFNKLQGLEN